MSSMTNQPVFGPDSSPSGVEDKPIVAILVTALTNFIGYSLSVSGKLTAFIPHIDPAWVTAFGGIAAALIYVIGGRYNAQYTRSNKRLRRENSNLRKAVHDLGGEEIPSGNH